MSERRGTDARGFGLSDDELRQLGFDVRPERVGAGAVSGAATGRGTGGDVPTAGSGTRWRRPGSATLTWTGTLAVLVFVGWVGSVRRGVPDPVAAAAPITTFSSARAMTRLTEIAARPRVTGSPEHERVQSHLSAALATLGLQPELRESVRAERDSTSVWAATLRNVVARVPGSAPTGAIAVVAHYDTAPLSPGAGDDGMGVATVLEALRALTAGAPLRNDLIVALLDGEAVGVSGARAWIEEDPRATDVHVVVSLDFRGASGPVVASVHGPLAGGLTRMLASSGTRPFASSLATSLAQARPSLARPFVERGASVVELSTLEDASRRGGSDDAPERASEETLQHAGAHLMALLDGLGRMDLGSGSFGGNGSGPTVGSDRRGWADDAREYVSSPLLGMIHYPEGWRMPASLGLLGLWGLVGLALRWRGGSRGGVFAGALLAAAIVGATGWLAGRSVLLLGGLHPEFGRFGAAFYAEGRHLLALVALALALVTGAYAVTRRRMRLDELLFGAMALPLLLCLWLTWRDPAAATAVQWPLGAGLLSALVIVAVGPARRRAPWVWALSTVLSVVVLLAALPSLELLANALTLRSAPLLGALFAMTLLLLLPTLDWLSRPRAAWMPFLGIGLAGTLVVLSLPSLRGGVAHPAPTALVYLADEPVRARLRLPGDDLAESDSSRVRRMDGRWLSLSGTADWWVRSWVPAPAARSADVGLLLLGSDERWEVAGVAPETELAPPRASLVTTSVEGAVRRVTLSVRPGLRGEMIGIHLPDRLEGSWTAIECATWSAAPAVRTVVHWGRPGSVGPLLGDEADAEWPPLSLELELPARERTLELEVVEHHLRPRKILGESYFVRPDSVVPDVGTGTDRVIQRTRMSIPLTLAVAGRS
jgi:hypothetical protein